jgi:hypothetical protein
MNAPEQTEARRRIRGARRRTIGTSGAAPSTAPRKPPGMISVSIAPRIEPSACTAASATPLEVTTGPARSATNRMS